MTGGHAAQRWASVALLTASLAACSSSSSSSGSSFDATAANGCMSHQQKMPAPADQEAKDVARTFAVLRYYTANGRQSFCDGKPATKTDLAWMRLYVKQGADAKAVSRWLGTP